MLSPGFVAGLQEKYSRLGRERQRQIHREQVKRDYHRDRNTEATQLVEERLKNSLDHTGTSKPCRASIGSMMKLLTFYLQMIVKRSESEEYPSVWAFSTFFYPKLMNGNHSDVKRWTKKVDLFTQSMVLVPIHLGMHWCLALIDIQRKMSGGAGQICL